LVFFSWKLRFLEGSLALPEQSPTLAICPAKRSFAKGVPKPELGNEFQEERSRHRNKLPTGKPCGASRQRVPTRERCSDLEKNFPPSERQKALTVPRGTLLNLNHDEKLPYPPCTIHIGEEGSHERNPPLSMSNGATAEEFAVFLEK
jgi:hypothetical protein